jgi:hypothetical protein
MTGREALEKVAGGEGARIVEELSRIGFVCVPREPTKRMLDEAYYAAMAENASEVWMEMISASEVMTTLENRAP